MERLWPSISIMRTASPSNAFPTDVIQFEEIKKTQSDGGGSFKLSLCANAKVSLIMISSIGKIRDVSVNLEICNGIGAKPIHKIPLCCDMGNRLRSQIWHNRPLVRRPGNLLVVGRESISRKVTSQDSDEKVVGRNRMESLGLSRRRHPSKSTCVKCYPWHQRFYAGNSRVLSHLKQESSSYPCR
jgi:hypothetical protein